MDSGGERLSSRAVLGGTVFTFVGSLAFFLFFYSHFPVLYDGDSYYHLAAARLYLEEGFRTDFPWTRFSIFYEGYGDKEFLFHLFLMPFVAFGDASTGGKIALALFDSLTASLLAWFGLRAVGRWGLIIPLWVYGTSVNFASRMVRLRSEILALPLLLLAVAAAAGRRYVLLGVLAFLYTLGYTAFHMMLFLCGLFFLYEALVERRLEWRLLLYPALGVGLGLLAHPQFPANLHVWLTQNFHYFRLKGMLDVGSEILPPTMRNTFMLNFGWLAGLLFLWLAREPGGEGEPRDRRGPYFLLAALTYGGLFLFMQRFAVYVVPFATLALLFLLSRRGLVPGGRVRLPFGVRVPLSLCMALCFLTALPASRHFFESLWRGTVWLEGRRADWEAFGRAVPEGARVAAPWGETAVYLFWAPQGSYLNVLDPVFMAVPEPRRYLVQRWIFDGQEPDVPLTTSAVLESDYLAFSPLFGRSGLVYRRLEKDPRAELLHDGYEKLFRVTGGDNGAFVLDWLVVPPSAATPPTAPGDDWQVYPRLTGDKARALEGYVDGRRIRGGDSCVTLLHEMEVSTPARVIWELAPYGATSLWIDGEPAATVAKPLRAMLGAGVAVKGVLEEGAHLVTVRTCAWEDYKGFYLVERARRPL